MNIKGLVIVISILVIAILGYGMLRNRDQVNYFGINMSREDAESLDRLNSNLSKAFSGPKPLYERGKGAVYYSTNSINKNSK